jgi:endoglucanase
MMALSAAGASGRRRCLRLHCSAIALVLWSLLLMNATADAANSACETWPAWQRFKQLYVSEDGRVIDASTPQQVTVSEGQAYALFFALMANDVQTFRTLLQWTSDNLAQGDLARSLPAWKWGRADDGAWRVLDGNAAADADLWIAYTLGEAGRLWGEVAYAEIGRALAARILRQEVASIPGLGATLLPGPKGFVRDQVWRLNASYVPLQVVRGVGRQTGHKLWNEVAKSSERLILASAPNGYAADWTEYQSKRGFAVDRDTGAVGSYDAIRVYLWAGTLAESDGARAKLAKQFAPMVNSAAQRPAPPEKVDINTLVMTGEGSPGFSAALLPLFANAGLNAALKSHRDRVQTQSLQSNQAYFSDVLSLFALGWLEQRYRFGSAGLLTVGWKQPCKSAP